MWIMASRAREADASWIKLIWPTDNCAQDRYNGTATEADTSWIKLIWPTDNCAQDRSSFIIFTLPYSVFKRLESQSAAPRWCVWTCLKILDQSRGLGLCWMSHIPHHVSVIMLERSRKCGIVRHCGDGSVSCLLGRPMLLLFGALLL